MGNRGPDWKGHRLPVQLDSAAPVPIERFNSLKVLCDLPMSYSSQQCLTYLVGIIIHNLVKGKWIKNRLNDLFNPAGSHSTGRGRTHSFVPAPHLLLSPISCVSYLYPVISQTQRCQIRTVAWFLFSSFSLFWTYSFDLQNTVKIYPPQRKPLRNNKKERVGSIYSEDWEHKELMFLNTVAGAGREAGKPGENCVLLKWQVPGSDWDSLQSVPQLQSFFPWHLWFMEYPCIN